MTRVRLGRLAGWVLTATAAAAAGCASAPPGRPTATVAIPVEDTLRICLNHGGFHAGERLHFKRRTCADHPGTKKQVCSDLPISSAHVVRVLDENCALVRVALGERIASGDELVR